MAPSQGKTSGFCALAPNLIRDTIKYLRGTDNNSLTFVYHLHFQNTVAYWAFSHHEAIKLLIEDKVAQLIFCV